MTEVSIKHLNAQERQAVDFAKLGELDQWISHTVFEVAERSNVPINRIMGMRWVLTWKDASPDDDPQVTVNSRKAKARLVIQGYTDPDLLTIRAEAPTLSRLGRNWLLQVSASKKFTIEMGDVKTAFLQGERTETAERDVYAEPTAEVRKLLGLTDQQILKLIGSVYGLRSAPRDWFKRVRKDLETLGFRCHTLDNCIFLVFDGDDLVGICGVYVDDFLMAGRQDDPRWQLMRKEVKKLYKFGKWEVGKFTLCGTEYEQRKDFSIKMTQKKYTEDLKPFPLPISSPKSKLDLRQVRTLRTGNGQLQWLSKNQRPDLSARISISASAISNPTVASLQEVNKLIKHAKRNPESHLIIQSIPLKDILIGAFTDAAWAVRPDGGSQGGMVIFASSTKLLDGQDCLFSLLDHKSWALKRKCRSSLSAETQAFSDVLDDLNYSRAFYLDFLQAKSIDLKNIDQQLSQQPYPSPIIMDCKSLYDCLETNVSMGLGAAEKRTSIEMLAGKQQMIATHVTTKWVNGDAQLADALSKPNGNHALSQAMQSGRIRITWDPEFVSAKKLKQQKKKAYFAPRTQHTIPKSRTTQPKPTMTTMTIPTDDDNNNPIPLDDYHDKLFKMD